MPVLKSSKKALKVSRRRKDENDALRKNLRNAVKALRASPTALNLKKVYSLLDRGSKKHILHKNRAARLKSGFSKLVKPVSKTSKKAGLAVKQ